MQKIVIASNNAGKLTEFKQVFSKHQLTIVTQSDYDVPSVAETGMTFVENALIKARHATKHTQLPAIADDSGLTVDALNGSPGIFSARYAGTHGNDEKNNEKLLKALANTPIEQRTAHFHCVLVYLRHIDDPAPILCHGIWHGIIANQAQGSNGFGYDPVFYLSKFNCTAAKLSSDQKNKISHRGKALSELIEKLKHPNA